MDLINKFAGGEQNQQQGGQSSGEGQKQEGGFLGGLGNKINEAAGGGRESEKNEDMLDKGLFCFVLLFIIYGRYL
jgi:hypothetical protein